jgi:Glycosyltransferase family 87
VVAILLLPLSYLSFPDAYLAWAAINLLFCVLIAAAMGTIANKLKLEPLKFFLGSCIFGIWITSHIIVKGQLSLMVCVAFSYFLICILNNRQLGSSFWLAVLLLIKPQYFIPLFLYMVGSRQWRAVSLTILFCCAGFLATLICLKDPYIWWDWLVALREFSHRFDSSKDYYAHMINMLGILRAIYGQNHGVIFADIARAVYFLLCGVCLLWPWMHRKQLNAVSAATIVAVSFFLSTYSLIHDVIILLPVCVIATALMRACGAISRMLPFYILASYVGFSVGGTMMSVWGFRLMVIILGAEAIYLLQRKNAWSEIINPEMVADSTQPPSAKIAPP